MVWFIRVNGVNGLLGLLELNDGKKPAINQSRLNSQTFKQLIKVCTAQLLSKTQIF